MAASHYKDEPFVKILPDGIAPELADAVGTNECRIGIFSREDSVVVLVALDNLLKGAAGQAVQNFNLKFGLDETLGLAAGENSTMNDRRWMRVAADVGEWLTRTRIAVGGALLAAAAAMAFGFWLGRFHPDSDYAAAEKRFSRALSAVERLENEQRKMRRERDANRTRLRLAEKTINSLGEEIERLNADSLERGEELAFYRQVLAEQSNSSAAVAIRGFEINPDFRPDRYRLSAVLARGENRRGEFKGGFELVVTLRRGRSQGNASPSSRRRRKHAGFSFVL